MNKDYFQNDPDYADFFTPTYECYEDDEVSPSKMPDIEDIKEEHDVDTNDKYVVAHVRVPIGVNTSGKAGAQILHLPLGDDSSPREIAQ
jgi:hypothetical protein